MKISRKWLAALAAMVLTTAAFAAKQKYPSYLTVEKDKDGVWASAKNKLPADLVIPDGVTAIGESAFSGPLESIVIPRSVTTLASKGAIFF